MMNSEETLLEPTLNDDLPLSIEVSPELSSGKAQTPPSQYWQAQALAEMLQTEFEEAQRQGRNTVMRDRFYLLATYYSRTLAILRSSLTSRKERLTSAALQNLTALQKSLNAMHKLDPQVAPTVLSISRDIRPRIIENLIVKVLQAAPTPLELAVIRQRVNELDVVLNTSENAVLKFLNNLVATGHVKEIGDRYRFTERAYNFLNLDRAGLELLLTPALLEQFENAGFQGLTEVVSRKNEFQQFLEKLNGYSPATAALFTGLCEAFTALRQEEREFSSWRAADLINSNFPRPYQYQAYAIFQGYGYHGQVIEAPTGSGKTMIGMMCMQDWLRTLSQGQSILVLVPTVNYQQQWLGELCYKGTGLRLPPHQIFTGTPTTLEAARNRQGISPSIVIMTYTSLAQVGSGTGKGGFDQDSIEIFLQGSNIQYVILDEVHKVVEDMQSVSAKITMLLTEWLRDGAFRGLIGFSGTASSFRTRFTLLGLDLVYVMPAAELIAYGFVAPFTEVGVPFAYSEREKRVRDLLDEYKLLLRSFIDLLGPASLRRWFSEIPLEERLIMGRNVFRMYAGNKEQHKALTSRLTAWETGQEIKLTELALITMIQIARNWSDEAMIQAAFTLDSPGTDSADRLEKGRVEFDKILNRANEIRQELQGLVFYEETIRRLSVSGFGTVFEGQPLRELSVEKTTIAERNEIVRNTLSATLTGLYDVISSWYLRVGEGRVATIKAIIEAERAIRPVSGIIIFDAGIKIQWEEGISLPGYGGVAGVFSQMLGDSRFTPMAALSREIYLPFSQENPLPDQIATFIQTEIMLDELGEALFGLVTQGLEIEAGRLMFLEKTLNELLDSYIRTLGPKSPGVGDFNQKVLAPLKRIVKSARIGQASAPLTARLSLRQYHLRNWLETFFDYSSIAASFSKARTAELRQVSGALQKFYVIPMPVGNRKQLMYDLTARIVDSDTLPINMIIVSTWARTGWNVIKPNVLIDATATRDITAWQQLRGRAMRARKSWTNECYRLVLLLLSSRPLALDQEISLPDDVVEAYRDMQDRTRSQIQLDEAAKKILLEAHTSLSTKYAASEQAEVIDADVLKQKIEKGVIEDFTQAEREQLVGELMLKRNKVTHIFELIKAFGSASQLNYNRTTHNWTRTLPVEEKHNREFGVNPLTGQYSSGKDHAPLIYAGDPRKDVPGELQAHLIDALKGCDPRVVKGWLKAVSREVQEQQFGEADAGKIQVD